MERVVFKTRVTDEKRIITECYINEKEITSVILHPNDRHNKVKAQRYALAKLLKEQVPRSEREQYWNWFFNHSKAARNLLLK